MAKEANKRSLDTGKAGDYGADMRLSDLVLPPRVILEELDKHGGDLSLPELSLYTKNAYGAVAKAVQELARQGIVSLQEAGHGLKIVTRL